MTAVAVLFLVAYAWPVLQPGLGSPWVSLCHGFTWVAWAVFVADYVVRFGLAPDRRRFVRRNIPDLMVIALPLLRPLRMLRLVTVLSVLNRRAGMRLHGRVALYLIGSTTLVLFVAALAALDAERSAADSPIHTFGDSLWWATTTITTVGYGDHYPVTLTGRLVAVGLMVAGIALLGTVTASLATWFLDRLRAVQEEEQAATRRDVELLALEVRSLREELARWAGSTGREPAGRPADRQHAASDR